MEAFPDTNRIVDSYSTWCNQREERLMADIRFDGQTFRDGRLRDNNYSREEVRDLMDGLLGVAVATALKGVNDTATCSMALLRAVFSETDRQRVPIHVDAERVLDAATTEALTAVERAEQKLASVGSRSALAPITALDRGDNTAKQLVDAQREIQRLNEKMRAMSAEYAQAMQQRSQLNENVLTMQDTMSLMQQDVSNMTQAQQMELQQTARHGQQKIVALEREIAQLNADMTGKLSASSQFQSLKKMLYEKNEMVKQLRAALSKYDPSAAYGGDDDIEAADDDD